MNEPTPRSVTDTLQGTEAVNHGGGTYEDVSTTVVIAIADAEGVDPMELKDPLHEWLDPDALDALVESMGSGYVTFDVAGYRVHVDADGTVTVDAEE